MRELATRIVAAIVITICAGCLSTPNLSHPGTVALQQQRAQVYEMYPENEPGPPIVGARPREYQDPTAEVNRVRPRPGDLIVAPAGQPLPQAPLAQPAIVTQPPQIYCPPVGQTGP